MCVYEGEKLIERFAFRWLIRDRVVSTSPRKFSAVMVGRIRKVKVCSRIRKVCSRIRKVCSRIRKVKVCSRIRKVKVCSRIRKVCSRILPVLVSCSLLFSCSLGIQSTTSTIPERLCVLEMDHVDCATRSFSDVSNTPHWTALLEVRSVMELSASMVFITMIRFIVTLQWYHLSVEMKIYWNKITCFLLFVVCADRDRRFYY